MYCFFLNYIYIYIWPNHLYLSLTLSFLIYAISIFLLKLCVRIDAHVMKSGLESMEFYVDAAKSAGYLINCIYLFFFSVDLYRY